jgi:hypothetical protein
MSDPLAIDCERWAEISDRQLVDEDVSDDEATFARDHAASCPFCGAEANLYDQLEEAPLAEADANAIVEAALAKKMPLKAVARGHHPAPSSSASSYLAGGIGAALALAAGVALMLTGIGERTAPRVAGKLGAITGEVRVDGAPAQSGTPIAVGSRVDVGNGTACIDFDGADHARSCLDAQSTVVIESAVPSPTVAARYSERRLTLGRGTVVTALDRQASGHRFEVLAHGTKTAVTGTVFSVTLEKQTQVKVRVHEGSVKTEAPNLVRSIPLANELDVTTNALARVPFAVRDHELELLGRSIARYQPPTQQTTPKLRLPNLPPPANAPNITPPTASAADMLATARKLRSQGNSAGAAEAYRKLMLTHPRSAEANAAQLSLAELQLGPLGDPNGALRSYDTYLRSGGGLSQEARYGRIMALRRLGRAAEERAAIEEFVRTYPSSVQARALKQKLEAP